MSKDIAILEREVTISALRKSLCVSLMSGLRVAWEVSGCEDNGACIRDIHSSGVAMIFFTSTTFSILAGMQLVFGDYIDVEPILDKVDRVWNMGTVYFVEE